MRARTIANIVVVAVVIAAGVMLWPKLKLPARESAAPLAPINAKAETFQITQAPAKFPKIVQATIDPPDVHVGDKQTLTVIVQDPTAIASVTAFIQTDHSTTTLPLLAQGEAAAGEVLAPRYALSKDHALYALAISHTDLASQAGGYGGKNIAEAADDAGRDLKYSGSWSVEDTHNTRYHTTFVVKDAAGRENSITLAWSDLCGIPNSGDWTMSSNCTLSSTDGVDNGNAIINSSISTLTIPSGSTFAYNSGKQITLTSGSIAVASGGTIKQTYLWKLDNDRDGFPQSTVVAQDTTPGANYARKNSYGTAGDDCNDANGNIFQTISGGTDADRDGVIFLGSATNGCVGAGPDASGYYVDSTINYHWLSNPSNFSDCNDTNAYIFVYRSAVKDADGDFWTVGSPATQCTGTRQSLVQPYHYRDADGTYPWLDAANQSSPADCNDAVYSLNNTSC